MRVVGAGLGRTGTLSLKFALEELLGGPCHHMMEVGKNPQHAPFFERAALGHPVDWAGFLSDYRAIVDWPGCAFWRELSTAFPDALVLLSRRPLDEWYDSAAATIFRDGGVDPADEAAVAWRRMWDAVRTRFTDDVSDRDATIDAARRHNETVIAETPPDRLLVHEPGDGWEPLCDRLGLAIPATPFPHVNTRRQFLDRAEAHRRDQSG